MASTEKTSSDLFDLTRQLVAIPSVSFEEREITDFLEMRLAALSWLDTVRIGDNLIARSQGNKNMRVLLGGHTDTVPAQGLSLIHI